MEQQDEHYFYQLQSRLQRAVSQRIFVLDIELLEHETVFEIHGSGYKTYRVGVHDSGQVVCTCPDFVTRGCKALIPCKHILYVASRVLGNAADEWFVPEWIGDTQGYIKGMFATSRRLRKITTTENQPAANVREDTSCAICYDEMNNNERMYMCHQCKHIVHYTCMCVWAQHHSTCPLCRAHADLRADHLKPNECKLRIDN